MKKFAFSLSSLFDIKKTLKDKIQAEYVAAEAFYRAAVEKQERLEQTFADKTQEYEIKAKNGMTVSDLKGYTFYFQELQERIKTAGHEADKAQREAESKRQELVNVHKEIRVLEKLYDKQYSEYLKDLEKSETKSVEDILSYKSADHNDDGEMSNG